MQHGRWKFVLRHAGAAHQPGDERRRQRPQLALEADDRLVAHRIPVGQYAREHRALHFVRRLQIGRENERRFCRIGAYHRPAEQCPLLAREKDHARTRIGDDEIRLHVVGRREARGASTLRRRHCSATRAKDQRGKPSAA